MPKQSAGILPFRLSPGVLEVFLVHPGGPFWRNKDDGVWSIAKGEFEETEHPLQAARREFHEETGFSLDGNFIELTPVKQPGGKLVNAWAIETELDPLALKSNRFSMEFPKGSGVLREFPEVDRAAWFAAGLAMRRILKGQRAFITQLAEKLGVSISS